MRFCWSVGGRVKKMSLVIEIQWKRRNERIILWMQAVYRYIWAEFG